MNAFDRITAVYGGTGCGKSTYVQRALSGARRVVVFDPLAGYGDWCRGEVVSSPSQMLEAMAQDWRGFRIAYQPGRKADFVQHLDRLCEALWDAQEVAYADGMGCTLVIEEANLGYPNERLPRDTRNAQTLVLQGRHVGVDIVAVSQRPANVAMDLRGNAQRIVVFRLAEYVDRQAIKQTVGPDHLDKILKLQGHEFVQFFQGQPVAANDNFSI